MTRFRLSLVGGRRWGIFRSFAAGCGLLVALGWSGAAGGVDARSTGELLMDEARSRALACGEEVPASEQACIAALLDAAVRVEPGLVAAHAWRYELASFANQPDAARDALQAILVADPNHETAFAAWLDERAPDVQRVEQRLAWLDKLRAKERSPYQEALLRAHLARIHWLRGDAAEAEKLVRAALNLCPASPEALQVRFDLALFRAQGGDQEAERAALEAGLAVLRLRPLDGMLAWRAGLSADENGLPTTAARFYDHARLLERRNPGQLPPDTHLVLSRNALARGDADDALREAQLATHAMRGTYAPYFHLHWLLSVRDADAAGTLADELGGAFARLQDPSSAPARAVAEAAWYHVWIEVQPQRALALAEAAAGRLDDDAFAARVLAWAKYRNGDIDGALAEALTLAEFDPFAAGLAALIQRGRGNDAAAAELLALDVWTNYVGAALVLRDAAYHPAATQRFVAATQPATQPVQDPDAVRAAFGIVLSPDAGVAEVFREWDFGALDFAREPEQFVSAEMVMDDRNPSVGEPWRVTFRVRNIGRRPITLGPDWMVNPVFLLSVRVDGPELEQFPEVYSVSLDRKRMLRPNEFVELERTIDVGGIARAHERWPQHLVGVTVNAVFDPVQRANGEWASSLPTVRVRPLTFARSPANVDASAWHLRFERLRGSHKAATFSSLAALGQLLGEAQRFALEPDALPYRPRSIPTRKVIEALRGAVAAGDADVRVHALEALHAAGLNRALLAAAQGCIEHPSWVVRLAAARQVSRLGDAALPTLRALADRDQDATVRAVARRLVEELAPEAAVTQPAE